MGIISDLWNKVFNKTTEKTKNGIPIAITSNGYGIDITKSTLVHASINVIAEESSKFIFKSVMKKKTDNGFVFQEKTDNLNKLFSIRPNPLQTMKDMIYWSVYRLEHKHNFYWFPVKKITTYSDGSKKTEVIEIYPIDSVSERMYFDNTTNEFYIAFLMSTGNEFRVAYKEVIHIRKNYGSKDYYFGSRDRSELLKRLGITNDINDLIPKAIKSSMLLKGIITAKSNADVAGLKKFKSEFEETLKSGTTQLGVMDVAGEYHPAQTDPKVVDNDVLKYLDSAVLNEFGVSLSIIQGTASENEWSSFYQKNIEPIKIALEQAATSVLFTDMELNHHNKIKIYDKLVQHFTIDTRLKIIKELGPRGYLSRSEQRELAGYEPDGGPEQVSLNYTQTEDQKEYQVGNEKKEEQDDTIQK